MIGVVVIGGVGGACGVGGGLGNVAAAVGYVVGSCTVERVVVRVSCNGVIVVRWRVLWYWCSCVRGWLWVYAVFRNLLRRCDCRVCCCGL